MLWLRYQHLIEESGCTFHNRISLAQKFLVATIEIMSDERIEAAFFESVRVLVNRLVNQGEGKKISLPDRKSTRLNSSHIQKSRMPSSA